MALLVLVALVLATGGCDTDASHILAAADPCAECYGEPPGQVDRCLEACREAAPPDTGGVE